MWRLKNIKEINPITKSFFALGTINTISIYEAFGEEALDLAIQKGTDIDNKMSVFKTESELSKINENAGKSYIPVSLDTYFVIKKAKELSFLSGKAFDITINPLISLWHNAVPDQTRIKKALDKIDAGNILLDEKNHCVLLKKEGQSISVGAIAKGYAADCVKNILSLHKIKNAIINLGGNIYVMGKNPQGGLWNVGIQDPSGERGGFLGYLSLKNKSVVTSGDYERFIEINSKHFSHILDPFSGYPVKNELKSVSVISSSSMDADALSTAIFVLGLKKGLTLLSKTPKTEAIIVTKSNEVYLSKGLKSKFVLTSEAYNLAQDGQGFL